MEPLFADEDGPPLKTTGDGPLLEFCAFHAARSLAVQRLMAECNTTVPENKQLVFRKWASIWAM